MPILLHVSELEPGMRLARNAMNRFNVLVRHGRALTQENIDALFRRFPDMTVQVVDPMLDQIVEFEDDSQDHAISNEVRRNVAAVANKVGDNIRSGVALKAENIQGVQQAIEEMIEYLKDNPVTSAIVDASSHWGDYLQEHCANVFYLSVVMGNTIRNYIKNERERFSAAKTIHGALNITPLATGAFFHDLGMVPIENLYTKTEPLTDEEIANVRAHPVNGARMLPDDIDPMIRLVVRCHHEGWDGSGYPEGLAGDKIHVFARIVRLADAYAAAISHKTYRRAKSPVMAMYEILYGPYRRFYDPVTLKVFASIMQPLPIGAKLKLACGRSAVVVRHNHENPFKPKIMIVFDELGDPLSQEQLEPPFSLGERPDIKVASFGKDDLSFLNHPPQDLTPEPHKLDSQYHPEMFDLAYP